MFLNINTHYYFFSSSLSRIRGSTYYSLKTELEEIINAKRLKDSAKSVSIISSRVFLKPFASVGVIYFLFRLSGSVVISHYTSTFFEFTGTSFDPQLVSIIIGVTRVLSSLSVPLILQTMTKRMAFITIGSAFTVGMLGGKFWSNSLH